ncbi:hypothetical protein J1605_021063 [Eschrichtius robustus]|uniref:Uncharacterized protein n=1 Tax=Eschrichtius robustus TaxID=9764 RepID=A0AB34HKA9_ESCRO|nr:hypothetical protein J1605_021063 [Eschrichtius robustus]
MCAQHLVNCNVTKIPVPMQEWLQLRIHLPPGASPGSAGSSRTKTRAGGGRAEPQKVVPTTPSPMLFDVASRPPRGGPKGPARERIPLECAAGRPFPSRPPLLAPHVSRGLPAEAVRTAPAPFLKCPGGGAEGGGSPARRETSAATHEGGRRHIPAPLRERKRLNEELRGGSGAPGEEAAAWKQTLASREPRAERRGREGGSGGGGARGALTGPFLSSLSGKLGSMSVQTCRCGGRPGSSPPPLRAAPRR